VEQGVFIKAKRVADARTMRADLWRGGIALRARITVPIPGAAKISALLNNPNILDASFLRAPTTSPANPPPTKANVT